MSHEAMWKELFGGIVIATREDIYEVAACLVVGVSSIIISSSSIIKSIVPKSCILTTFTLPCSCE